MFLGGCGGYQLVCQAMSVAIINLWWSVMMSMCGEVRIITVNYLVTCWGLSGAVLSGCVGVVVGMGVGACR